MRTLPYFTPPQIVYRLLRRIILYHCWFWLSASAPLLSISPIASSIRGNNNHSTLYRPWLITKSFFYHAGRIPSPTPPELLGNCWHLLLFQWLTRLGFLSRLAKFLSDASNLLGKKSFRQVLQHRQCNLLFQNLAIFHNQGQKRPHPLLCTYSCPNII